MAGFRVRRFGVGRRRAAHESEAHDADLAKRAGAALVAADERMRLTADELGFAEAELGSGATAQSSETLATVRRQLNAAFRLNRLNHDEAATAATGSAAIEASGGATPGATGGVTAGAASSAADDARARNLRILQLCEWAETVLDVQASALADRAKRARHAPEIIASVRVDIERLRARIPYARAVTDHLAARYSSAALARGQVNPAEAEQLLGFAEHSVGVAELRRSAGRGEQADVALEASVASVRRAATLLDAVETFEAEALRAESAPAAVAGESRRDLAVALAGAPAPAPAAAPAPAGDRAMHPAPTAHHLHHLHHALEHADRKLDIARDAIAGHPGWISAEALTRLAESEHIRVVLTHFLGGSAAIIMTDDRREQVIALAQRVAYLASESLRQARRDIAASRMSRAYA
ncbi:hypothetical protein [Agromyces laixinhei]|uniref:hypothetical protein n=1 Tax=Agromyces laixinhei TaxID=2585717 RepID=UPI0012ED0AD4|nr:hypothetical protein [Agromyces laixinhei]